MNAFPADANPAGTTIMVRGDGRSEASGIKKDSHANEVDRRNESDRNGPDTQSDTVPLSSSAFPAPYPALRTLIVDDDYFVVTALERKINWRSLNIEQVYTAHNVAQAREILQQHPVHILISDIEMPQGSGLELLAWIREMNYNVQAILLTNYADFNYAQKAIELQSFEYFLKPIEFDKLMLIIQKAVQRVKEQQSAQRAIQEGQYWQRNHSKMLEHFWRKLISDSSSSLIKPAVLAESIREQNLDYRLDDKVQPLLFHLFPHNGSMGSQEKGLFDFALQNVFYELFQQPSFSVDTMLEYKDDHWMAMLKWKGAPEQDLLRELCASFLQKARPYLKCEACCTIALPSQMEGVSLCIRQLLTMDSEMVQARNEIYDVQDYLELAREPAEYAAPDLAHWEELLNRNQPEVLLAETSRYLRGRLSHRMLNVSVLSLFRLDLVQLVYSFLKMKGIQAHKLYTGKTHEQLLAQSLNSIEDMEAFVQDLVTTAMEYRDFTERATSVVEEIKQHILSHYGDELSRNDLAEIVYLNPDYLARLFKKETGISLGSYVIQVRIAAAKQLLETTSLSVYAVANKVGYGNYSYFSKLFKQAVGCSPNEYKKEQQGSF
ncbi:helix-turn-helix domain-containing protein [Paenibacillus yonginensis]|uniref:helix-turn-helix domain-containing protein n=1 Tax=Paenibacillus yonginensis TaxID=1462996 RepID=UPI000A40F0F9|nr:helix-turn-helix domain-containing protein [Paenibacillus yonginensis]